MKQPHSIPEAHSTPRTGRSAIRSIGMHRLLVAMLLVLAAGLRLWGIAFGLPYFEHPDEWAVADEALRMLRTGNWSPFSYTYPTLYVYLGVGVAALHFVWGAMLGLYHSLAEIDPARFYVWARTLTALLGTGCVALTYAIGRRLYSRTAAVIAAALVAVLPSAVADAHYVTVDTPAAFFALLAFLAITRIPAEGSTRRLAGSAMLAGILVGLAAATKYTAGVLVVALLAACILAAQAHATNTRLRLRLAFALALAAGIGIVLGWTVGVPLWLGEWQRIIADLRSIAEHYREVGHPGAESSQPALFYWGALRNEAWLAAWLLVPALALAFVRHRRADVLVLAVVIPFVVQLSSVRVVFVRNAIPLVPFVCLLVAACVVWLIERATRAVSKRTDRTMPPGSRSILAAVVLAVLLAQPLPKSLHDEWLRAQPTTRILATEWVREHAAAGTRIWLEDQTLILPKTLRVQGGQPITSHTPDWYRENGFRFLVANDSIRKSDPALLADFGVPAARFAPQGQRLGHTFLVFDTGIADLAGEQRTPSGATLGGGAITLDGYRHPGIVQAGERLPLALFWRANQAIVHDYVVFVHLLDARDTKVAQRDLPPLEGSRPTSSWQAGELLRDDQDLPIPADTPAGRYRLVVGMYDAATFASINDAGPIAIGEVEIYR